MFFFFLDRVSLKTLKITQTMRLLTCMNSWKTINHVFYGMISISPISTKKNDSTRFSLIFTQKYAPDMVSSMIAGSWMGSTVILERPSIEHLMRSTPRILGSLTVGLVTLLVITEMKVILLESELSMVLKIILPFGNRH